jgi:hypothetical protein
MQASSSLPTTISHITIMILTTHLIAQLIPPHDPALPWQNPSIC